MAGFLKIYNSFDLLKLQEKFQHTRLLFSLLFYYSTVLECLFYKSIILVDPYLSIISILKKNAHQLFIFSYYYLFYKVPRYTTYRS